mgnify:CR=1 FL=1
MYMYINSPGGSVTAGFAMFDTMRYVKADVSTINVGLAASMGSLLLAGGSKGKRLALPHSRVMIHQPSMGGIRGQASDIKVEAEQILAVRKRCVDYYAASLLTADAGVSGWLSLSAADAAWKVGSGRELHIRRAAWILP